MMIPSAHLVRPRTPLPLPRFIHVPGGTFRMGSNALGAGEGPEGPVHVSSFWCSRTATSNDEFAAFVRATGYRTTAERCREEAVWHTFATSDRGAHPVVMVSWDDASAFAEWLTSRAGLRFRLPTEAEWEKAARGGLHGAPYPWGASAPEDVGANFGAIGRAAMPRTVAVTELPQNGYGLHLGGNVWEWVQDWYDPRAYSSDERRDPRGPADGVERCRRGGAYNNRRGFRLRVSSRNRLHPAATFRNMGFRVVSDGDPAVRERWRDTEAPQSVRASRARPAAELVWDEALRAAIAQRAGLRARIEAALDVLRPSMEEDRGGVQVVAAHSGVVELELIGTCHGCPKSDLTFADLRETLLRHLPELHRVIRVGAHAAPAPDRS